MTAPTAAVLDQPLDPQAPPVLFHGLPVDQVDAYEQRIEQAVRQALRRVMRQVTAGLGDVTTAAALTAADAGSISPDDLSGIGPLWHTQVEQELQPIVGQVYRDSAGAVHSSMVDAVGDLPRLSPVAAETYLAQSATTFDAIGAQLWETARTQLIDGMAAGEDIPTLAARLRNTVPDLTARQATLVARTQVNDAANAASYAMAQASGLDLVKGWETTADLRTRETHLFAGSRYSGPGMIPMAGMFMVGGWPAERPHDPSLPPAERYNCRCTIVYGMREAPSPPSTQQQRIDQLEADYTRRLTALETAHSARMDAIEAAFTKEVYQLGADAAQALTVAHEQRTAELVAAYEARRELMRATLERRLAIVRGEQPPPIPLATTPKGLPVGSPELPLPIPVTGQPTLVPVREVLAQAQTVPEVQRAFIAEWERLIADEPDIIRGTVRFSPRADVQTAREHAEGLLRGIERFPAAQLDVTYGEMASYAQTVGSRVRFGSSWSRWRDDYLASLRRDGAKNAQGISFHPITTASPQGTALHEFGHVLEYALAFDAEGTYDYQLLSQVETLAKKIVSELAGERGIPPVDLIKLEIGEYAASHTQELLAEAFADVMVNGDAASELSQRIFAMLVREYERIAPPRAGGMVAVRPLPTRPSPVPRQAELEQLNGPLSEAQKELARHADEMPVGSVETVQGLGGQTTIVTYADGYRLVRKVHPAKGGIRDAVELTDAEQLGARVISAVGGNAPQVLRLSSTTIVEEYVEGRTAHDLLDLAGTRIRAALPDSDQGHIVGLADVLMANSDRETNWLLDNQGRLWSIDQGSAFPENYALQRGYSEFADWLLSYDGGIADSNDLAAGEMAIAATRLELLRSDFVRLGRQDWFDQMMVRFREVQAAAQGDRKIFEGAGGPLATRPAPLADGLDVLELPALRSLATEYEITNASRLGRERLIAELRQRGAMSPEARRAAELVQVQGRAIAEILQFLDAGTDLATIVESLAGRAELKDLLAIVRRAKDRDKLATSLRGFATRRGITIPSKVQLKAIQTAERKAAAAAKREAALAARAEKARQAEIKAQVKAVQGGDFRTLVQTDTGAFRAADDSLWTVETFASEAEARERVLAMALRDLVDPGQAGPTPLAIVGQGAPGPGGWQIAYVGTVPRAAITLDDWLASVSLNQLKKVTPARLRALVAKVGLGPDDAERLIARRADAVLREQLMAHRFHSRGAPLLSDFKALAAERNPGRFINGQYGSAGLRARVTRFEVNSPYRYQPVVIKGEVFRGGRKVGNFSRDYYLDNGELVAHHGYLELDASVRGSGFAEEFNANLIDWYRRSGIKQVRLTANIDVGGYAWARAGYEFADAADARNILAGLRNIILDIQHRGPQGLPPGIRGASRLAGLSDAELDAQVRAAQALLQRASQYQFGDPQYPRAYEISQLGRHAGQGKDDIWIGKAAMLNSYWSAVLYL
jgi:hypothetical protein